MGAMGWKFGFSESLAIVVVIGFSVDYTVHIAHAYLHSKKVNGRHERTAYSFLIMGVSVLYGALTTIACAIPLSQSAGDMTGKLGLIIIFTICFALFWAMVFFPA